MKNYYLDDLVSNGFGSIYGKDIEKMLKKEAQELGRIIMKYQKEYEKSYTPKQYSRTGKTRQGITGAISGVKVSKSFNGSYIAKLEFKNDLMYHDSVVKNSNKKGHAFMLISDGWNQSQRETKHSRALRKQVYRFTYYEGYDILGKALKEYNGKKPNGVSVEIEWSGKYYK